MDLNQIAQIAYDQVYPNAEQATSVKVEHFIETAKTRYAYEMFLLSKELKRADGEWNIPDTLLREDTLTIENNEADISALKIFKSFEGGLWIAKLGDFSCDCGYTKHTVNLSNILCDDEYHGNSKPYVPIGKKIKFPFGSHGKTVPIIYASSGEDVEGEIEVDDAIADRVGDYLWKRFTGKLPEDRTVNSNANV